MNTNSSRLAKRLILALSFLAVTSSSALANEPLLSQAAESVALQKAVAMSTTQPWQHTEKIGCREYQVATIFIDAKPEEVWSVLTDYTDAPQIYSNVKKLNVLRSDGPDKQLAFEVTSVGGLLKYDYVLDVHEMEAKHRIEWHRHSGAFKANDGYWQLTPVKEGTLVTYSKFIDGGFMPPMAVVNFELRRAMPVVMSNLKTAIIKKHHIALSETA